MADTAAPLSPKSALKSRQKNWWQTSVVRRSSSAVDEAVDELTEKSQFLFRKSPRSSATSPTTSISSRYSFASEDPDTRIAQFNRGEIQVGKLLGEGSFSCVYEVTGFSLQQMPTLPNLRSVTPATTTTTGTSSSGAFQIIDQGESDEPSDDNTHQQQHETLVESLRQDVASAASSKYALKHLKPDLLVCTKDFEQAATDIVMEAKYLSIFDHPNILKLRGWAFGGTSAFTMTGHHDGFFLLTDRLVETLSERIKRWQEGEASETNNVACKTRYGLQIAQAIKYLHSLRIVFRDLKPSNIGFKSDDTCQLFDFGLCRELPAACRGRPYTYPLVEVDEGEDEESAPRTVVGDSMYASMDISWEEDMEDDLDDLEVSKPCREEVFFMSGAGTQIYMDPAILINNRYNEKCDVYSWAMVFTEMLTLDKPFPFYSMEEHRQYICVEGDRPCLEGDFDEIPDILQYLLEQAWVGDVSQRLSMAQVCSELEAIEPEELENETRDDACVSSALVNVSCRLCGALDQIKRRILSFLEWTVQGLVSLLRRRSQVATDLPPVQTLPSVQDTPVPGETTSAHTNVDVLHKQEDEVDERSGEPSFSFDTCGKEPQDPPAVVRGVNKRLYSRKASSFSTSATTDDEYDEEEMWRATSSYGTMQVLAEQSTGVVQ